jgi:hypothetical protein
MLKGDLEEIMAELEESRRKLVNLKMQKDAAVGIHMPAPSAVNGNLSPEKTADRSKRLRELRDSLDETKVLVEPSVHSSLSLSLSLSLTHTHTHTHTQHTNTN